MATKFRREFKNVVYNYTDAETKVREATSNDPWGPSSAVMAELADYTYHVQAYGMVMGMLWKRLNDHGKNWRHVYKSLSVLEYLIKNGSERVVQQCKDNMFSIQTLKDFQYVDKDGKDQGYNIREKAKLLVTILKDDQMLKDERMRAHQARDRVQAEASHPTPSPKSTKKVQFNEDPASSTSDSTDGTVRSGQNVEQARPSDNSEEEMQLNLAIQLSKQHAEEDEKLREQEEESLRAAIALSAVETEEEESKTTAAKEEEGSGDLLLDTSVPGLGDPWSGLPAEPPPSYDLVTGTPIDDPWATTAPTTSTVPTGQIDPFSTPWDKPSSTSGQATNPDPWSTDINFTIPPIDPAIDLGLPPASSLSTDPASLNPFDLSGLGTTLPPPISGNSSEMAPRIEEQFLGENSALVDLDLLLAPPPTVVGATSVNPFGLTSGGSLQQNPFEANKPMAPTLNQLAAANQPGFEDHLPAPLIPSGGESPQLRTSQPAPGNNQTFNPFS